MGPMTANAEEGLSAPSVDAASCLSVPLHIKCNTNDGVGRELRTRDRRRVYREPAGQKLGRMELYGEDTHPQRRRVVRGGGE